MKLWHRKKMLQMQIVYLLKYSMKKDIFSIDHTFHWLTWTLGIFLWLFCIANIYLETHAEDLLEQAFSTAKSQETVIDLWSTTNAVGNEFLKQSVGLQGNLWQWCLLNGNMLNAKDLKTQKDSIWSSLSDTDFCQQVLWWDWNVPAVTAQAPLIVRIAKRMLRLTIVLSITMVLYNGVMYIVESAKGGEVKTATKNLGLIVWGILVALLSLWIINLISSITISTLTTSDWGSTSSCSINWSVLAGDNLKKYICENSTFGTTYTWTWYPDRTWNRCKRNSDYTAITDTEMISKCIELGGTYQN